MYSILLWQTYDSKFAKEDINAQTIFKNLKIVFR